MQVVLIALALFIATSARAGGRDDAAQVPLTPAECEQHDTAWLAIRACTALLDGQNIDAAARSRYLTSRGDAWIKEEEPQQAVEDYTRAIEADPANMTALAGRARTYKNLGQHDSAINDWTRALDKAGTDTSAGGPTIEEIYLERGTSLGASGKTAAAIADFAKVLELNPKSAKAHLASAAAYATANDRAKALEEFELAIKAAPTDIAPYMARAQAAERWGDQNLAIDSYLGAVKVNPRGAWYARKALQRLGVENPL